MCPEVKASTAELLQLLFWPCIRAKKKNHSIPPPTWLGPSPTQKLILLQFPSAPLLASSLGKQSQGKSCLCSLWACAARTGWHWDATALDGTEFLLPTAAGAHRHHPQQQAPFAPPAQHSGTSSLPHLAYHTDNPVSDCIFPAATWYTFCVRQDKTRTKYLIHTNTPIMTWRYIIISLNLQWSRTKQMKPLS